jgi:hypothetical protein
MEKKRDTARQYDDVGRRRKDDTGEEKRRRWCQLKFVWV